MKKVLRKSNFVAGILILVVVCLGIVFAGDVIFKEGVIEGVKFQSTDCLATGLKAVAFGYHTTASEDYSTAMGYHTTASGEYSTAMGYYTTASGPRSTALGENSTAGGYRSIAIGYFTTAGAYTPLPAAYTTAIGSSFTNNIRDSFAVGYGQKDFSVESGLVTVHNDLYVTDDVSAHTYSEHSTFYDKDVCGKALDYSEDSSNTIKVNADGEKEYNHEADPAFLQKQVTVKDYDKYTEEEVWNDLLEQTITNRIYETHQELRSNLSMKVAWLRQCVFELKQENQALKDDIAKLKAAVGIE